MIESNAELCVKITATIRGLREDLRELEERLGEELDASRHLELVPERDTE